MVDDVDKRIEALEQELEVLKTRKQARDCSLSMSDATERILEAAGIPASEREQFTSDAGKDSRRLNKAGHNLVVVSLCGDDAAPDGVNDPDAATGNNKKECPYCGDTFLPAGLGLHKRYCADNPDSRGNAPDKKTCEHCGKSMDPRGYNNHIRFCDQKPDDGGDDDGEWLECDDCNYKAKNKQSMAQHRRVHKYRYECPRCDERLKTPLNFNRHIKARHGITWMKPRNNRVRIDGGDTEKYAGGMA